MPDIYETIIGMEIHAELKTQSKMFCGCSTNYFGSPPNTHCCPVCLGLPGALPVPNKKAIEWTIMLGLALNCDIPLFSKFDRKNYFYPDLPKGYQISQYDQPIARNGVLKFKIQNSKFKIEERIIRINRVHLEEDTGKLMHATIHNEKVSLVDFNRSGVPLVEIVTEPDLRSSEEVKIFLKKLHQVIRYLGISDADMEKGSMRLEPNISVRKVKSQKSKVKSNDLPNYKVEVKNINSFKFVGKAIDFEVKRQTEILERGEVPKQETRGWEEKKGVTLPQRSKEEAHDYRYFPEPDIPPMRWSKSLISQLKEQIPELADTKFARFKTQFGLPDQDTERLTETRELAEYFEDGIKIYDLRFKNISISPKILANWLINRNVDIGKVTPEELLKQIIQAKKVNQVDEKKVKEIIQKVLKQNPKAVSDYKAGRTNVIMFLVGQVMRELKGKGDPSQIKKLLEESLKISSFAKIP